MNLNYSKYINNLNTTNQWIPSLKNAISRALSEDKHVVVIAIARKMARLLEFYFTIDSDLQRILTQTPNVSFITEHAIPYCLQNATELDTEVIILDDLIVYGDTVETVYENVYWLTGIKSKIIAMAASQKFRMSLLQKDVLYPDLSNQCNPDVIKNDLIPAFTAKNSWDIVSLCHPIDLEHTILRIKYQQDKNPEAIAKNLKDQFAKAFPEAFAYIISHQIPKSFKYTYSVSIVFNSDDGNVINSDFSKLRFFIGNGEIRIVSYAPNIWETPILQDSSVMIFNSPGLSSVWPILIETLDRAMGADNKTDYQEIEASFIEQDFKNRVELSAVVMANYLVSFDSLCLKKQIIEEVFKIVLGMNAKFEIAVEDIKLIVGEKLAKEIYPILKSVFDHAISKVTVLDRSSLRPEILREPLLPSFDENKFKENRIMDIFLMVNIFTSLSLIFNRLSIEFGLIDKRKEDKVKVGETYDSLFNSLTLLYKNRDDKVQEALHKWIDSRIDLGVVVPKYEYFNGPTGYKIWRRYFRAGEREDSMKGVARAVYLIASDIFQNNESLTIEDFIKIICPELEKLNEVSQGQLDLDAFNEGLSVNDEFNNKDFNLWLYLIRLGVIKVSDFPKVKKGYIGLQEDGSPLFQSTSIF